MNPDLAKAQKIFEKRTPLVGNTDALGPNVIEAIAEGIALGRREGLELGSKLIADAIKATEPYHGANLSVRGESDIPRT